MNKMFLCILAFGSAFLLSGCFSMGAKSLPPDVESVSVMVREGRTLREAVIVAATRRRWMPSEIDPSTIRCTLVQRSNKVIVDVVLIDDRRYSIKMVESNIPAAKLSQWANNLQREIAKQAAQ